MVRHSFLIRTFEGSNPSIFDKFSNSLMVERLAVN